MADGDNRTIDQKVTTVATTDGTSTSIATPTFSGTGVALIIADVWAQRKDTADEKFFERRSVTVRYTSGSAISSVTSALHTHDPSTTGWTTSQSGGEIFVQGTAAENIQWFCRLQVLSGDVTYTP